MPHPFLRLSISIPVAAYVDFQEIFREAKNALKLQKKMKIDTNNNSGRPAMEEVEMGKELVRRRNKAKKRGCNFETVSNYGNSSSALS